MNKRISGIIVAAALIAPAGTQAATLALWDNDNLDSTPTRSNAVTTVGADVSAGYLEMGVGLAAPGIGNSAVPWDNALDSFIFTNATSLSSAIAAGHYFSFTVNPDVGKQVGYSNIFARITSNDAGDGVGSSLQLVLMSNITGFLDGDELGSFVATHAPGQGVTDVTVTTNDFDVSGFVALQDQPSEVEFRLYVIANGGSYSRVALGHISEINGTDDLRVEGIAEEAVTLPIIKLASWDNDNLDGTTRSNAAEFVETGMSASDLALSANWNNDDTPWADTIWAYIGDLPAITNLATSISSNRYFNIVLEPDAGKQADYTKFSGLIALNNYSTTEGTSVKFVLMSSVTGFQVGDEIGSFIASSPPSPPPFTTIDIPFEIDISGVSALQDATGEVEFRMYMVLNGGFYSRMAIGHISFNDNNDDILVEGRIEDVPYIQPTIISWTSVSPSVMKLVIDAPSAPLLYYPKATTSLNIVPWAGVAHSDDGVNPFVITNLSYSTAEGDNEAIYVQSTNSAEFFGIGAE